MADPAGPPVLIDTDVWSCLVLDSRDTDARVVGWRRAVLGRVLVIAAQTEGELRFGALKRRWGSERLGRLDALLARTPTAPVTPEVVRAFAELRAACAHAGRALADKHHMGDAWVAATAVAYGLPLLSGDAIYVDVEGLTMLDSMSS